MYKAKTLGRNKVWMMNDDVAEAGEAVETDGMERFG